MDDMADLDDGLDRDAAGFFIPRMVAPIDASAFQGKPVPPRRWHVQDVIPAGTVTLLSGAGGTGKSLVALQLAVATVLGRRWIGLDVTEGRALYLSAEDPMEELHRRLDAIASDLGCNFDAFAGLGLIPLAGEDAVLAVPDRRGVMAPTDLYRSLDDAIGRHRSELVVLDTLADLHGGSENDRAQVRQFVGMLRGLAIRHDAAVLLLSHPSLSGLTSGTGLSGSTAWDASVRSRLYLDRVKTVEGSEVTEADPDVRVLKIMKANYGPIGQQITLRWQAGAFIPTGSAPQEGPVTAMSLRAKADRVFLDLVAAYEAEGRPVSAVRSANYAPALFARDERSEGVTRRAFEDAMNRLFAARRIRVEEYGPPSKRRKRILVNTPRGEG